MSEEQIESFRAQFIKDGKEIESLKAQLVEKDETIGQMTPWLITLKNLQVMEQRPDAKYAIEKVLERARKAVKE